MSSIIDETISGALIDKALAQTARAGHKYATVPLPWVSDWLGYATAAGPSFDCSSYCGLPGWDFNKVECDDDGNITLCLREPGHEGDCG